MKPSVAVTIGNPNGIGPEVTAGAVRRLEKSQMQRLIIIGDSCSRRRYFTGALARLSYIEINDPSFKPRPGVKSAASGALSFRFIQRAADLALERGVGGIVTAPISKELIVRSGQAGFIDHTSYFAGRFGAENYNMMFYSRDLIVVLATIHIPLASVRGQINQTTLERAFNNAAAFCRSCFGGKKTRTIGVCGLNPHAGENGMMGTEERDIIGPVIKGYRKKGIRLIGPLPPDTAFYRALHKEMDVVIALYHDQGLAPFKTLHFRDGVNTTLGLPVVRTSPDHGTAFELAGKGRADPSSMKEALGLAFRLLDHG